MPDQAFSTISSMAGPKLPARHQTLSDFLTAATTVPFNRVTTIQAIERNGELLCQCLGWVSGAGRSVADWHANVSNQALRDMALTVGNTELSQDADKPHESWQRSRLTQLLVKRFAADLEFEESEVHRMSILAVLLELGHYQLLHSQDSNAPDKPADQSVDRSALLASERIEFGTSGDVAGADWLAAHQFAAADCDVLRYQYETVPTLSEASSDLVLIALCGRIADALLSDFAFPETYTQVLIERFGFDLETLQNMAEQAYIALRAENDELLQNHAFPERLALANLGQQLSSVENEKALLELAVGCFGMTDLVFARLNQNKLYLNCHGDMLEVPSQGASVIARAFQTQTAFSAEEDALAAIVDKQVLSRMAADVLWLVPSEMGVSICGYPQDQSPETHDAYLVAAFQSAASRLLKRELSEQPVIELEVVQQRIRELNHEVNNPLAIVQNYLKTLSLRLGPENSAQGDIKTIADEMLRIGTIVQKYAEIGSSRAEDSLVDVNELIARHSDVLAGANPNVRFSLELADVLPELRLPIDELTQVVINLLKNSVEALDGQTNAEVLIATGQVNVNGQHYAEIVIEDNGPGIADEVYQNLFSPDNSTKGEGHSGIGLSVVHRLVLEMAGSISCRSSASGCQFQILLPTLRQ